MEIIFVLEIIIRLAMPGLVLSAIIILLIRKMLVGKDKEVIYTFIVSFCVLASFLVLLWKIEKPNELYVEMKEYNDNQSLVGLSKEEVIELLGEPKYEHNTRENKKIYTYYAGELRKEWYFGKCYTTDYYELDIFFDQDDKVEQTNRKISP